MKKLGFSFEPRKKCYYVDNHEHPDTVQYRNEFINRYFEYEFCCYRWVSVSKKERDEMLLLGLISADIGYCYKQGENEIQYEFHVDDHEIFYNKCRHLPYGGYLSVRMPPGSKPLLIISQDECIYKQYLFTKGVWVMPDGSKQIIPKDEGHGVMLSGFTSRELGYGFPISKKILKKVNERRKGQYYSDKEATILLHGTAKKAPLTSTPFSVELEYGASHDGYWSYEHMVLQLEDCVAVLKYTHPQFDILFLLDHSNGHNRMRPDGLNLNRINIRHGGKQSIMRPSLLNSSHFGPFHNSSFKLQPGDTQIMKFLDTDEGPCYLTAEQRISQRLDRQTGKRKQEQLTVPDLIEKLKAHGIPNPKGNKKTIHNLCNQLNIPLSVDVPKIQCGWLHKPKGALQILFERGWISPTHIHMYTTHGRTPSRSTATSNTTPSVSPSTTTLPSSPLSYPTPLHNPTNFPVQTDASTTAAVNNNEHFDDPTGCCFSINKIMTLQNDFMHEVTLLQHHATQMGVNIDRTPKCHPELAGEGIEYLWAMAKLKYRCTPICQKRTKEKFIKLVRSCTDPLDNLGIHKARSCSKKARSYMKMYKVLQSVDLDPDKTVNKHHILESSMKLYNSLKKVSKTHRNVLDKNRVDVTEISNCYNDYNDVIDNTINKSRIKTEKQSELIGALVKKMSCI